jgi:heat shock protein HslJ
MPLRRNIVDHRHMADNVASLPWGTQWDLIRAADPTVDWAAVHVTLGLQEGRAGGRSAVNRYFGTCRELPGNRLELGPFGMTMMAGPPEAMAAETVYHRLLEQVRRFRTDDAELVLLDEAGLELLAFAPSADPA